MQQETIIIISLAITVIFIIFLSITFMNRKSKCKEGEFSLDGKGSFFDPCVKCDKDPVTLVKEIPIGAYQCPMGVLDDVIGKGVNLLVKMTDSIPGILNPFNNTDSIPNPCDYSDKQIGVNVDIAKGALDTIGCNVRIQGPNEILTSGHVTGRITLVYDDKRIVRSVVTEN